MASHAKLSRNKETKSEHRRQMQPQLLLAGESVTLRIWAGCIAALCGGVLMSLSHSGADTGSLFGGIAAGDAMLIGAALLWSVQVK